MPKNLSFFSSAAGLALSPAYDLASGIVFPSESIDKTYALAIGDAFSADEISPYEWANFANGCRLSLPLVGKELERMASLVLKVIDAVAQQALREGAEPGHLSFVADAIKSECQRQLNFAPQIRRVSPTVL